MVDVVTGGTSTSASMHGFTVAGKSGTSRRVATGGRGYAPGRHTASFVALFPADRPQYVMLVKLDDPKGAYVGGKAAAPVSKIVLEAALAARDASLDRDALPAPESLVPVVAESGAPDAAPTAAVALADVPAVFTLPRRAVPRRAGQSARVVPRVRGLSIRAAVLALHRAGFRVTVTSVGVAASGTVPAAGALASPGGLVRLQSAP
jgi:cell division protein FtsI (penicillin-binding protein 3)